MLLLTECNFVAALSRKGDALEMRSAFFVPHLVVAFVIILEGQTPMPHDHDAVDIGGQPGENELVEPFAEAADEPRLGW